VRGGAKDFFDTEPTGEIKHCARKERTRH